MSDPPLPPPSYSKSGPLAASPQGDLAHARSRFARPAPSAGSLRPGKTRASVLLRLGRRLLAWLPTTNTISTTHTKGKVNPCLQVLPLAELTLMSRARIGRWRVGETCRLLVVVRWETEGGRGGGGLGGGGGAGIVSTDPVHVYILRVALSEAWRINILRRVE